MTAYVDGRPCCIGCGRRFASMVALDKHLTNQLCTSMPDTQMRSLGLINRGTYWVLRNRLATHEEVAA